MKILDCSFEVWIESWLVEMSATLSLFLMVPCQSMTGLTAGGGVVELFFFASQIRRDAPSRKIYICASILLKLGIKSLILLSFQPTFHQAISILK